MRSLILLPLLFASALATASEGNQAFHLLEQLSKSLRELNFSTSFVVIKNNNAEPYHWIRGVGEQGDELEILSMLNGAGRDVFRRNKTVSYVEPGIAPYSVNSNYISGPIPDILSGNIEDLTANYDLVSVGKSRILGRTANIIRIVSKDPFRYGYKLWLAEESGFLLKLAITNEVGKVLEQIQFMHIEFDENINPLLNQIEKAELPSVIEIPANANNKEHSWQVSWLPQGFKQINANRHRVLHTNMATDFKLFSDGLIDVSVYVTASHPKSRPLGIAQDGATFVFNNVYQDFEVSIVGKLPPKTAKKIADSVVFRGDK